MKGNVFGVSQERENRQMSVIEFIVDLLSPTALAAITEGISYEESARQIVANVPKLSNNKFFEEFYVYVFRAKNVQYTEHGLVSDISHKEAVEELKQTAKMVKIPRHRPAESTINAARIAFGVSKKRIAARKKADAVPDTLHSIQSAMFRLAQLQNN